MSSASVPTFVKIENQDVLYEAVVSAKPRLQLELEKVEEIRGIRATSSQPERLIFNYKGGNSKTWPLTLILNEDYVTLRSVYTRLLSSAFSGTARKDVL